MKYKNEKKPQGSKDAYDKNEYRSKGKKPQRGGKRC
jgi:hypothetical protein